MICCNNVKFSFVLTCWWCMQNFSIDGFAFHQRVLISFGFTVILSCSLKVIPVDPQGIPLSKKVKIYFLYGFKS